VKGDEAREMRQSAWLKRLDCDATRPETAQSSSRSGAYSCHRTKQTITNQINQLLATRREMFDCRPDIQSSRITKKVVFVAFMRKRLTTLNAMLKHRTHWRTEEPQHA